MSRINTNVSSLIAQRVLRKNNSSLNNSLARLSTGLKINTGADNPAGLIASENLRAEKAGIQQAIDAPSFHTEHWPSSFWPRHARPGKLVIEGRYPAEVAEALRSRGHQVDIGGEWSEGRLTAASREDPWRKAAANPRGMQGYAAGR